MVSGTFAKRVLSCRIGFLLLCSKLQKPPKYVLRPLVILETTDSVNHYTLVFYKHISQLNAFSVQLSCYILWPKHLNHCSSSNKETAFFLLLYNFTHSMSTLTVGPSSLSI